VAGAPALGSTDKMLLKGTLAGADLLRLPGVNSQSVVDKLVSFRNPAAANYPAFVYQAGAPAGFSRHVFADLQGNTYRNNFFHTRMDLINYAERQNTDLLGALPYLVHSRPSLNAPSWRPPYDATAKVNGRGDSHEFLYRTRERAADSLNPDVLAVTYPSAATVSSYLRDGTPFTYKVDPGSPLLQRRFPLDRLAWLGPSGPVSPGTSQSVQSAFGLRWSAAKGYWEYVGHAGNTLQKQIKTLQEVAQELREPNFFELLQAAMLNGSLGQRYGDAQLGNPAWQNSITLHVLRIGANIIDQYDGDCFPTVIEYDQGLGQPYWRAVGVEDLPYIETLQVVVGEKPNSTSLVPYVVPRFSNPHQPPVGNLSRPRVRVSFAGQMRFRSWWGIYPNATNPPVMPEQIVGVPLGSPVFSSPLTASALGDFRAPRIAHADEFAPILPDTLLSTPSGPIWSSLPVQYHTRPLVGLRMPDFVQNLSKTGPPGTTAVPAHTNLRGFQFYYGYRSGAGPVSFCNFFLEYETPDGRWLPYNYFFGINDPETWASTTTYATSFITGAPVNGFHPYIGIQFSRSQLGWHVLFLKSDPRSFRINGYIMNTPVNMDLEPQPSLWSPFGPSITPSNSQGNGYGGRDSQVPQLPGTPCNPVAQRGPLRVSYTGAQADSYYPAWLSRNFRSEHTMRISAYEDTDGIRRLADSGRYANTKPANAAPLIGNPYERMADRPVVLNRPFRNVAELGFAFRDLPWKSLDFFSENSADAALLDFFTLTDIDNKMVEDRINLQSAPPEVLLALLNDSPLDAFGPSDALPSAKAKEITDILFAQRELMAETQGLIKNIIGPLTGDYTNPSSSTILADTNFPSSTLPGDPAANARIKSRREAVARALAPVSDDRTWVLLIDIIAQSGRFSPGETNIARFNVSGERRARIHLSLDRFTGQILSQQIEYLAQ
jgi:hypothetical protein